MNAETAKYVAYLNKIESDKQTGAIDRLLEELEHDI